VGFWAALALARMRLRLGWRRDVVRLVVDRPEFPSCSVDVCGKLWDSLPHHRTFVDQAEPDTSLRDRNRLAFTLCGRTVKRIQ
jgi:hypothetical protein